MSVEIISVGSEFIVQDYRNTRIAAIANLLLEAGLEIDYVCAVSDQEDRVEDLLRQAISRSNLIFVSGGALSGEYDTLKKLLTRILKKRLVLNERILGTIKERFREQGEVMPRTAEKFALVPHETNVLENEIGTLPGFLFADENTHVVLLPDNAAEIERMLRLHVLPRIDAKTFQSGATRRVILKTCGMTPETIKDHLKRIERENLRHVLSYVRNGEETSVIITVRSDIPTEVEQKLEGIEQHVRKILGDAVYGSGAQTLEEVVGDLLTEQQKTVALAESCSGGLIANKLTNIAGSSAYFERGVVTYSNDAKITMLDVSPHILESHGAVSAETAVAMAEGARWLARTTFGLAVTGIAGPSGGTAAKPVGLVYIALAAEEAKTHWKRYHFSGSRLSVKHQTAQAALDMLRQQLIHSK